MTLDELGQDKRAAILAIAAKHGVRRVRVFGSFARGDANEESDLDLLIEAGPCTPPWFPGGLLVDLEEVLGRRVRRPLLKPTSFLAMGFNPWKS